MKNFIAQNSSAIFTLLGALGGGLISLAASLSLSRREYTFRLWEKIIERRISAHEELLASALKLRVMVSLDQNDESGEPMRSPQLLMSKDHFDSWFLEFARISVAGSPWYITEAKREANFVQDYTFNLYNTLNHVPSDLYPNVGTIVREDFIKLSSEFEKKIYRFFESDIHKLKVARLSAWHKYPLEKTIQRLEETKLWENRESIENLSHPRLQKPLIS